MEDEAAEVERERLSRLRRFLMDRRARVSPETVGLRATGYRRVPGLRRTEVARLVGVSDDWYVRFESGRAIRVSIEFVTNVADVLQLDRCERAELYTLAIPELYATFAPIVAEVCRQSSLRNTYAGDRRASAPDEMKSQARFSA